jgi:hypothetical protein
MTLFAPAALAGALPSPASRYHTPVSTGWGPSQDLGTAGAAYHRCRRAQGHEQEQAIARIVDLTRVKRHVAASSMDSKVDSTDGQHEKTG